MLEKVGGENDIEGIVPDGRQVIGGTGVESDVPGERPRAVRIQVDR